MAKTGLIALFVTACLSIPAFGQAATTDAWGRFKPGSWIRVKENYTPKGAKPKENEFQYQKRKLAAVEKDHCLVRIQTEDQPFEPWKERRDVLFHIASARAEVVERKNLPDESLSVQGRTLTCRVREIGYRTGGGGPPDRTVKVWLSDRVPGHLARLEGSYSDEDDGKAITRKLTIRLTSLAEKVAVGRKILTCAVLEIVLSWEKSTQTTTSWVSEEVPGLIVRRRTELVGQNLIHDWRVVDFQAAE